MNSVKTQISGKEKPLLERGLTNWIASRLEKAGVSAIEIQMGNSEPFVMGIVRSGVPKPRMQIVRPGAVVRSARKGLLGWAESYIAGDWLTPDIQAVAHWGAANEEPLERVFNASWISQKINRLIHRLNNNSKRGSRKNIAAHYDLGNEFYKLWLDPSMTYSSALFHSPSDTLEQAQHNKYQAVLNWLDIEPDSKVLEIGCGWGGFARQFKKHSSAGYRGVTLSHEQLAYAREHTEGDVQFELTDYRDIKGQYDGIVSIEMIEAVGEEHWPTYFRKIYDSLKPGGKAVLQVITIDEKRFETYREGADFIQKYIFPGGMLPSHSIMQEQIATAGLELLSTHSFGRDYQRTVDEWYRNFNANWQAIKPLGFDESFRRMWNYYLAYCSAGFANDSIDVRLYQIGKAL
ncbi:SAM-dependent methyltransferase [Sansalvadorimonas verongulae]|uniref:SAM-dependent methyltransferase n=1 Tax=Sansalvadorimonas verongulae TaxID=2172824 RepID=UPI0012BD014D|nr:cyclopropane-fatty-acyl-phospholipid synthase family protein [Sansalvadorimonas verongulae]MTI14730.1 class I SAM-dependent methyltransferase [Sansalvadorimonas verongulae]